MVGFYDNEYIYIWIINLPIIVRFVLSGEVFLSAMLQAD